MAWLSFHYPINLQKGEHGTCATVRLSLSLCLSMICRRFSMLAIQSGVPSAFIFISESSTQWMNEWMNILFQMELCFGYCKKHHSVPCSYVSWLLCIHVSLKYTELYFKCFVFLTWKCLDTSISHPYLSGLPEERPRFTLARVLLTGTAAISKRRSLVKVSPKLQPPYLHKITKFMFALLNKIFSSWSKILK